LPTTTVTSSADAIVCKTLEGIVVSWNGAAERLFGYGEKEMIGQTIRHIIPADRLQEEEAFLAHIAAGRAIAHFETVRLHKDGRQLNVIVTISPIRDEAGTITGATKIARDISAQKLVEERFRESGAKFQATFENAAVGMAHAAPDGSWILVNSCLCEITGYSKEELLTKSFRDITHPEDLQADLVQVQRMLDGEINRYRREKRYLRKDGSTIWVKLTVSCVRGDEGAVDYFIAVVEDILTQKLAEELLLRQADLLDQSDDAIMMRKLGGTITFWSRGAERLYGWRPEEAIGRSTYSLLQASAPVPAEEIEALVEKEGHWYGELVHTTRDGRKAVVESRQVRVCYGNEQYVLETDRDIADRKEAEAALVESERFTRRVLDNLFAFVGVMSLDGTLVAVNRAPLEAAGIQASDVIGKKFWDCYWWNYSEEVQKQLADAYERAMRGEAVRYDVPVRMAGDSRMWIDFQLAPLRDDDGRVTHLIPSATDLTASRQAQEDSLESEAKFRSIISTAVDAITVIGETGLIQFINPAGQRMLGYEAAELVGKNVSVLMPEPYRSAHDGYISAYLRTGEAKIIGRTREVAYQRKDGSIFPADLAVTEWQAGGKRYFTGIIRDISERKRNEEKIQLLLREVNHRANNMLSVVQAVARRTIAATSEEFIARFENRIQSLAASQGLLVRNEWMGADLGELIRSQLGHFSDLLGTRIELRGPSLLINASAAQTLGMALHELATNAGKYGALAEDGGHISIEWSLAPGESGNEVFLMNWRERGGKPVSAPSRQGFGSTVLGRVVSDSLDGKVALEFEYSGLSWRLECPAANVSYGSNTKSG
jgi:PAS domain S-box-containing protein